MKDDPGQVHGKIRRRPDNDQPAEDRKSGGPLFSSGPKREQSEEQLEDAEGNANSQSLEGGGRKEALNNHFLPGRPGCWWHGMLDLFGLLLFGRLFHRLQLSNL